MSNLRFKAIIIKFKKEHRDGTTENSSTVGICLYDSKAKAESPVLPISVVTKAWPSLKLQPLRTYTSRFVRFLNYAFFESDTPAASIADITPDTVLSFLTDISASSSGRAYVKATENAVSAGLYYLWRHEMLPGFKESDFVRFSTHRGETVYLRDVRNCYTLPAAEIENRIHDMDGSVVIRMLELAARYTPRIAFGVYLQIFGGLRYAEVLTLDYSDLHFNFGGNETTLFVDIENKDHRPDVRYGSLSKAKKPRRQIVFYIPELFDPLYELNQRLTAKSPSNALILNANGDPMIERSYSEYFNNLKKKLIESLLNDTDFSVRNYGRMLATSKWSTHICRGIYSNMVAGTATTTAQIARARGDSAQDSSIPYLTDSAKIREQITENVRALIAGRPPQIGDDNG